MKRIFLFIALLAMVAMVRAQTSTIEDNGSYISFNFDSGDTVCVGKENIVLVKASGDDVFIMTSQRWSSDRITRIVRLDYDDFGYSSAGVLRDYLAVISFKAYTEVYSYDGGNLDTVSYYQGANLQYHIVYGYSGTVVSSKTIVTQ